MPVETTGQRIVREFMDSPRMQTAQLAENIDTAIADALARSETDRLAKIITRSGMTAQEFSKLLSERDPDPTIDKDSVKR